MTGKTKPNYGYNAGFFVPEVVLEDNDIEELEDICDAPGFIEAVTGAIGFFKGHKINELEASTLSEQRAALTELETLTDDLRHALNNLDSDTEEKILQALNYELPEFLHSLTNNHLHRLSAGVELARRAIEPECGPPTKTAERAFAEVLGNIFTHYGIEPATEDTGITGTDFYQAVKIGLTQGWPSETEWPEKRTFSPPKASTIRRLAKEYTP